MYNANSFINLMKKCTKETIGDGKSAWVYYGTIVSVTPLRILIDNHEEPYDERFFIGLPATRLLKLGNVVLMLAVNNHQKFLMLDVYDRVSVIFDLAGGYRAIGDDTPLAQSVIRNSLWAVIRVPQNPIRQGYRFVRWSTIPPSDFEITDSMTITAIWEVV